MNEECTRIGVCVFIGNDPRNWVVEARDFPPAEEAAAEAYAVARAPDATSVVITRRYSRVIGSTRRNQWRVGTHVIVESEDYGVCV